MTQENNNPDQAPTNDGASMEEILSSIRQAMSEHTPDRNQEEPAAPPPEQDVLELHKPVQWNDDNTEEVAPIKPPSTLLSEEAEERTRRVLNTLDEQIQRKQTHEIEQAYFALEKMLRPILTSWCDKHLPSIVTQSVQKEIKALVRNLSQKRDA